MKLTEAEISLLTRSGFNERFDAESKNYANQRQCYEALEAELIGVIGKRHYNSFENFKSCRSKYLNRKLSRATVK